MRGAAKLKQTYVYVWQIVICICFTIPLFSQDAKMPELTDAQKIEKARELDLQVLNAYKDKNYVKAETLSQEALKLYSTVKDKDDLIIATTYQNIAEFQFKQRQYSEAMPNLERALQIRQKKLPKSHLLISETQRKLGNLQTRMGDFATADSLYQIAYRNMMVTLKSYHSDMRPLADDLRNLAVLLESRDNFERAKQLYEQAYRIISRAIGYKHYELTYLNRDLRALALLLSKQGKLSEASSLYENTLRRFSILLGDDDPEVIRVSENLRDVSTAFRDEQNFDQAKSALDISYRYIRNILYNDANYLSFFSDDYRQIAQAAMRAKSPDDAEENLYKAIYIMNEMLKAEDERFADLATDFRNLGKLYQEKSEFRKAEEHFNNNIRLMRIQLGNDNPTLAIYGNDFRLLGKSVQNDKNFRYAEDLFDRAYEIVINSAGISHPMLVMVGRDFRELSNALGIDNVIDFKYKAELLMRSISIFEESETQNDQEIVTSCNDLIKLAKAYDQKKYNGNAKEIYEYVLPILIKYTNENHQDVVAVRKALSEFENKKLEYFPLDEPVISKAAESVNPPPSPPGESQSLPSLYPEIDVIRYPTLKAPNIAQPSTSFDVKISLTEDLITKEVEILAGKKTEFGQVVFRLPDREKWLIDVIISAPLLKVENDEQTGQITLPREGNSTEAVFKIQVPGADCAPSQSTIYATLWHEGTFLAKISRKILISGLEENNFSIASEEGIPGIPRPIAKPEGGNLKTTQQDEAITQVPSISLSPNYQTPDLTLWILKDFSSENAGRYEIQINSPYLQPFSGSFVISPQTADWMQKQTSNITRGAVPLNAPTQSSETPRQRIFKMQAFGKQLYNQMAPEELKKAVRELLQKRGGKFKSIQIYTNNPGIPWELMHTTAKMDGFDKPDFLGNRFRIARWHISGNFNVLSRPPQQSTMDELVMISPRYEGRMALPSQQKEVTALQNVKGFRKVEGKFSPLQELFTDYPSGIIHFAGHGEVRQSIENLPEYVILLEDAQLDLLTWRGITSADSRNNPFFFFNACDVGQSQNVANFVDGWAPAVLEAGASGYIGGLWPLSDASAADFAVNFYDILNKELEKGPVNIADLLMETRKQFTKNGDPTFLAYIYYGDPNFNFVR